jgi:DNA-binding transcriptional MerR regulator
MTEPTTLDAPRAAFVPPSPLARFYMTSDLRAATGLTRTHLDYYLREGLIVPTARTESGYLLFDDRELALLRDIVAARQAGESLRDIRHRIGR